jgi:hypothetical protein
VKTDTEPHYENLSRKTGYLIGGAAILLSVGFDKLFAANVSWAMGIVAIVMLFTITVYWHLRRAVWFWIMIGAIVALHVAVSMLIPWSDTHYPGPYLLFPAFLDLAAVILCVRFVGRVAHRETDDAA